MRRGEHDRRRGDGPLICLAASGGGHLRQLVELREFWREHSHFLVTEPTALGQSIDEIEEIEFVPHVALGQARIGQALKMLRDGWRNCWQSLAIIRRRRPDLVLTTGAGSMGFVVLWARLFGARIALVDSFARFAAPSAFARIAGLLAHLRIAQSKQAARIWGKAKAFEPLQELDGAPPEKDALLFATIGATLPFDRLAKLVLEAKTAGHIPEKVVLQAGSAAASFPQTDDVRIVECLPQGELLAIVQKASMVVCHGGTGSIMTALEHHCRTIVIPRQSALGEHYDDHQVEITESFAARDLVFRANDAAQFGKALRAAREAAPRAARRDYSELVEYLRANAMPITGRDVAQ